MTSPDQSRPPAPADHSFRSGPDANHCGFLYWQAAGKHIECDQPEQDHQPDQPRPEAPYVTGLEPPTTCIHTYFGNPCPERRQSCRSPDAALLLIRERTARGMQPRLWEVRLLLAELDRVSRA